MESVIVQNPLQKLKRQRGKHLQKLQRLLSLPGALAKEAQASRINNTTKSWMNNTTKSWILFLSGALAEEAKTAQKALTYKDMI